MDGMRELWDIFFTFCRIGGFTFGGGYAMLPMLQKEVVERKHWATEDELLDYFAIGQCTPGIIAGNTATFVGYKTRGVLGAIFATTGVVFPSLIIVMAISAFLSNFSNLAIIQHAFGAIRVVVGVLILNAVIKMGKKTMIDLLCVGLAVGTFLVSVILSPSPVLIVLGAAMLGVIIPVIKGVPKV